MYANNKREGFLNLIINYNIIRYSKKNEKKSNKIRLDHRLS